MAISGLAFGEDLSTRATLFSEAENKALQLQSVPKLAKPNKPSETPTISIPNCN